jgi:hypothetical protein
MAPIGDRSWLVRAPGRYGTREKLNGRKTVETEIIVSTDWIEKTCTEHDLNAGF